VRHASPPDQLIAFRPCLRSSGRLTETLSTQFPAVTLEAVAAEFAKAPETKETNAKVAQLGVLVREEAAVAMAVFRSAEMWLRIKTPAVSDGNNFGVEVQNYVITELAAMRTAMDAMIIGGRDWHWSRATGLEKLFGKDESEKSTSENTEQEDAKPATTKKSSSSKTTSSSPATYPDHKRYLVDVDVRQYHNCFNQLNEIRNNYLRAHLLFSKNLKRLGDPRGEGADGRSGNVMSMF